MSRLEVVFSKSNVCFGGVIVVPGNGGLVDDRRLQAVSIERACVLLSAVAVCCFLCSLQARWCVRMSSMQDVFVVVVDDLFRVGRCCN